MAAARPFGPEPTTTASSVSAPPRPRPPVTSFEASPAVRELADWCRERSTCRADRGAVPDVPPVPPLALPVDAHADGLNDRLGDTCGSREIAQSPLPELVVLAVADEAVRHV